MYYISSLVFYQVEKWCHTRSRKCDITSMNRLGNLKLPSPKSLLSLLEYDILCLKHSRASWIYICGKLAQNRRISFAYFRRTEAKVNSGKARRARSASRVRGEERGRSATRASRSPRFRLCSPKIRKNYTFSAGYAEGIEFMIRWLCSIRGLISTLSTRDHFCCLPRSIKNKMLLAALLNFLCSNPIVTKEISYWPA